MNAQEWVKAAESYLDECGTRASCARASEFANRMARSPAQLAREFHSVVGFCVKRYFTDAQIERAKRLLRETQLGTAEIASMTGFGTLRSFYRTFRRATGSSPTEYRARNVTGGR